MKRICKKLSVMRQPSVLSSQLSVTDERRFKSGLSPEFSLLNSSPAFTLLELLTSIAVLAIISSLLFAAFNQATKVWLQGENRVETYTEARAVLDFMTRELSQAIATTNIPFLANGSNVAFVATIGDDTTDGMDLMEVVYRPSWRSYNYGSGDPTLVFTNVIGSLPVKLVRRISPFSAFSATPSVCWNYGLNVSCPTPIPPSTIPPWDFYSSPLTWPETSSSNRTAVLAENVVGIQFQFQDTKAPPGVYSYWNSIDPATYPGTPWWNEIGGIPYNLNFGDALNMSNRAPALVIITLTTVDRRTAARLGTVPYPSAAWNNIVRESRRQFTTSVAIPNRQP